DLVGKERVEVDTDDGTDPACEVQAARDVPVPGAAALLLGPEEVERDQHGRHSSAVHGDGIGLEVPEGAGAPERDVVDFLEVPDDRPQDPDALLAGLAR